LSIRQLSHLGYSSAVPHGVEAHVCERDGETDGESLTPHEAGVGRTRDQRQPDMEVSQVLHRLRHVRLVKVRFIKLKV